MRETDVLASFAAEMSVLEFKRKGQVRWCKAYIVRFKQLTGIFSPKLYPRDSSSAFRGSCELKADERVAVNARRARMGRRHDGCEGAMVNWK